MNEQLQNVIQALKEKFGCEESVHRGEHTLFAEAKDIYEASQTLRDEFGFNLLSSLTATDYWPEENPRIHISYQFTSIEQKIMLRLRVPLSGDDLNVGTQLAAVKGEINIHGIVMGGNNDRSGVIDAGFTQGMDIRAVSQNKVFYIFFDYYRVFLNDCITYLPGVEGFSGSASDPPSTEYQNGGVFCRIRH